MDRRTVGTKNPGCCREVAVSLKKKTSSKVADRFQWLDLEASRNTYRIVINNLQIRSSCYCLNGENVRKQMQAYPDVD